MHIPEGMLPGAVCIAGYALTSAAMWYSLKQINKKEDPHKEIPKAALLTAAFFISTFILIPIPPASVHPMLIGIIGAMLGYFAFPAITIALFFQAVLFQHGGITTLGVNAFLFGTSALLSYYVYLYAARIFQSKKYQQVIAGFLAGISGVAVTVFLFYLVLILFLPTTLDVETEKKAIMLLSLSHFPIMILEGVFSASLFGYLSKMKPQLIEVIK